MTALSTLIYYCVHKIVFFLP